MMTAHFEPRDPDYARRVRASFDRQAFMTTVGAELCTVRPGETVIKAPITGAVTQQHGFAHAGVVIALVDTSCGYAALSLTDPGLEVLTVELKVNLLAPAIGEHLRATGRVVRSGRMLTICQGDAFAETPSGERHIATMLATMSVRASTASPNAATDAAG